MIEYRILMSESGRALVLHRVGNHRHVMTAPVNSTSSDWLLVTIRAHRPRPGYPEPRVYHIFSSCYSSDGRGMIKNLQHMQIDYPYYFCRIDTDSKVTNGTLPETRPNPSLSPPHMQPCGETEPQYLCLSVAASCPPVHRIPAR